jgi:hypothetical protein
MINLKKKRIVLFYIITSLIISLAFISINSLAYDMNETEIITLNEYENVGYGVLDGNRIRENQLLETQYATDVRYVKEAIGSTTHSMVNDSSVFRTNLASSYYDDNFRYDIEQSTWRYNPIYIQAFNNTGTGPNLSFTTGINNQGTLTLGSETAIEMEADTYYVFKVRLQAGEIYDLNMKSISSVSYYIYFNDYLSRSGSVNGETRNIQPLAARGSGDYYIYLFSNNDNFVVFDPVKIDVSSISAGDFVSGDFVNEPNNIWDEERQVFVDNDNSEHVDAYFVRIPKGVYEFKYIRFDGGISTNAYGLIPSLYYEAGLSNTYFNIAIGSSYDDKFVFSFEYDTKVLVYITAERDNNDYIEFDYIFSVDKLDCPTLKAGEIHEYEDNFLCFGIDVKETQLAYFNISAVGSVMVWFVDYKDKNLGYGSYYMLDDNTLIVDKLLLQPGYYYFFNPTEGLYDFDIEYNAVLVEEFTDSFDFELSQRDGDPSNYKLFKIVNTDFDFHNYNISLLPALNRTVVFGCYTYLENNPMVFWGTSDLVGYQQVAGINQGYPVNNTQMLNFLSTGEPTIRYVLFEIYDIYNNTGYSWPSYGSVFSEPETVTLRFSTDTDNPDVFANVNLNFEELDFIDNGSYLVNYDFDTTYSDFDIYMIRATVPEHTWYKVEIVIIDGLRDDSFYNLQNLDGYFPGYFYRDAVWNKYYNLDTFTPTHFINYDGSNVSYVTFDIEFGVFDPNLIFMFGVDHTALNGSIEFKFIPIDCTPISSIASVIMKGLGLGGIIALAAIGGVAGFGILVFVVFRVVIPKIKSKTPASPPSQY